LEAQTRLKLSTLYIGNSKLDQFLMRQLGKRIETSPNLHVQVLIDHTRGTRVESDGHSSFSMLQNLKSKVCVWFNEGVVQILEQRPDQSISASERWIF
jgi:hypothetical protein